MSVFAPIPKRSTRSYRSAIPFGRLTADQKAAYKEIMAALNRGDRFIRLSGGAGTGKSALVARIVEDLKAAGETVHMTATTHKAAQVLRKNLIMKGVDARTVHSYLGLKLSPNRKGGYKLVRDKNKEVNDCGVAICDECSMVGKDEWKFILETSEVKWLFVGDANQLPPVNEEASPTLSLPGPELTEVVRQAAGNPIIQLATHIRTGGDYTFETNFVDGKGVGVSLDKRKFLRGALRAVKDPRFENNPSITRILTYRNATAKDYNRIIRQNLYGQGAPYFVPGEWLVARDSWYLDTAPILLNSEEVRVIEAEEDEAYDRRTGRWKIWRLGVESEDRYRRRIEVLHESELVRYDRELNSIRNMAKANKSSAVIFDKDASVSWHDFYALLERFARVDYAYAQTIHKAQGSTFESTFFDFEDAYTCRSADRRALVYVACSRPSDRLAIFNPNNY